MNPILEIQDVTVSFDGFKAINHLNLTLYEGELRVLIGPNGAGKTTLQDAITGKVKPTSGCIYFKGKDLRRFPEYKIARLGIGRKFQTPRVYSNLTVWQNIELAVVPNKTVIASLFSRRTKSEKEKIGRLLEIVGLTAKANIQAAFLSHGEKQWLEIGMLVAQDPELLLVDEPVAGMTDEETFLTGDLLVSLSESHTILVIEHDMEFVRQLNRHVTVLHEGSVLCEGTMEEVQNDPRTIEVYLGKSEEVA
ncbi:urea ABC transporter ATP-binding protein UrtD [Geitlerinema sp. PCC 9228]|jgi:urea transport system ATP-binding protein|uniref:urea ABC transporter ATP-binding protein UrtD n=1 Tax=Geitlerinema sp. PCC 9228 TaxID=111611 RepID=UPI0008F9870A|nr:urea ABC transporter ATP-binding protein UrtD [Geitlerinema sp. PCC 9228]